MPLVAPLVVLSDVPTPRSILDRDGAIFAGLPPGGTR